MRFERDESKMPLIETIKETLERATGWARPSRREVAAALRRRKANAYRFSDDGLVPNNPDLPFIFYSGAIKVTDASDPAALFEVLFEGNGWKGTWRDGIYDYAHYHSRTHEVLGIARGKATVRFGGATGRVVNLKAGDVAILPAGTGHQRLEASDDLLVVGAYPTPDRYDECRAVPEDHARAIKLIPKVPRPRKDPVYGSGGPLLHLWFKRG